VKAEDNIPQTWKTWSDEQWGN